MTEPTTAPILQTPVMVDYTGRDFYSLRDQLIQRVKDRVNNGTGTAWYGNDEADFGLALIEAFSYMGDVVSYYIDRVANEGTLLTASQLDSILNLAYSYGYIPMGYRSSTCTVEFRTSVSNPLLVIPSGTQLRATITTNDVVNQLIFTTTSAATFTSSTKTVTNAVGTGTAATFTATAHGFAVGNIVSVTGVVPAAYNVSNLSITSVTTDTFTVSSTATGAYSSGGSATAVTGTATATATHGEDISLRTANQATAPNISGEILGVSDGSAAQTFQLKDNTVVDNTVRVFVVTGSGSTASYGEWKEVTHLSDFGPNDAVFKTIKGSNNTVVVQFGDGVSGAIPNNLATIKAQYSSGGGAVGNIPAGTPFTFVYSPPAGITAFSSTRASGGLDPEGADAIRTKAPRAFTAVNRAVSLADYEGLSFQTNGVAKAKAVADVWSSVTLYIAPSSQDPTDLYPGKDSSNSAVTADWTKLQTSLTDNSATSLKSKLLIGTTLTVAPPTYTDVSMTVRYSKSPQTTEAQIQTFIKQYISTYYSYNTTSFAQIIAPQEIEFILRYVPGILNVWVTELRRKDTETAGTLSTLVGTASEIFVFNTDNITMSQQSADASLLSPTGGLATTNGSLTPTYSPTTYNYLHTLSGSNTTTAITPVVNASGAKVTVDGTLITVAAPSKTITNTVSGTTVNSTIVVTAPDGRTQQTYTVAVYKP